MSVSHQEKRQDGWGLATNLEGAEQAFVHAHHGTRIVKLPAVVWRAEQGHELTLGEELVTILDDLVGTADQVHVMLLEEARHHVRSKGKADTSVIFAPARYILVGVGPQEIAKQAAVGDLVEQVSVR